MHTVLYSQFFCSDPPDISARNLSWLEASKDADGILNEASAVVPYVVRTEREKAFPASNEGGL